MKVYKGDYFENNGAVMVLADHACYRLPLLADTPGMPCLCPRGHAWGFIGNGPGQLAHDLLHDMLGESVPAVVYERFRDEVVARLHGEYGWELTEEKAREELARVCVFTGHAGLHLKGTAAADSPELEPLPDDRPAVTIHTDGACSGNPGPGAFVAILSNGAKRREVVGGHDATTNNQMELMGAIAGLEALTKPCRVEIRTDSRYLQRGITEWVPDWQRKGWRNSRNKPVANRALWERLLLAIGPHNVSWTWVQGHAGDPENEAADALARKTIGLIRSGKLAPSDLDSVLA